MRWNDEKIKIFNDFYGKISDKELAKKIGAKDHRTIEKYAKKIGVWVSKRLEKEKYNFIYESRFLLTTKEIGDAIGIDSRNVSGYLRRMGIYKSEGNYVWTEDKLEILKKDYAYGNWDKLTRDLGIDHPSRIHGKARKLGLNRKINFTKEEEKYLIDNYNSMSLEDLSISLKKDINKLKRKAMLLGLDNNYNQWSDEETDLLREKYPFYKNTILKERFFQNFSLKRIGTKAYILGLKKEYNYKYFTDEEILSALKSIYEDIGRTITFKEVRKFGFPSTATFVSRFGGYTQACLLAGIPINTNDVFTRNPHAFLAKTGDVCYSASEVIITEFLFDNKIRYQKEVFYKKISSDSRCHNKKMDWLLFDNTIVEFFGMNSKEYKHKTKEKIDICNSSNLSLIEIYQTDLYKLDKVFEKYLLI